MIRSENSQKGRKPKASIEKEKILSCTWIHFIRDPTEPRPGESEAWVIIGGKALKPCYLPGLHAAFYFFLESIYQLRQAKRRIRSI